MKRKRVRPATWIVCYLLIAWPLCTRSADAGNDSLSVAETAGKALSVRDFATAERIYREALSRDAENPEYRDGLGLALAGLGQVSDALVSVRSALGIEERSSFYHHLGVLLAQSGDRRNAIRAFENAIRLDRSAWESRYALSEQCLQAGDSEGAASLLEQVVRQRPALAVARLDLALTWLQLDRSEQDALRQLLVATTIEAANPAPRLALGELYARRNDYDRAIRELQRAVELDVANPEGHYNLGLALRLDGKLDQAQRELRKTVELNPNHALAHKALGLVFREEGNLTEARHELLRSVDVDANDAEAQHLLGSVLLRLDDPESAAVHLLAATRLNPVLTEAYALLAAAYMKAGRTDDAGQARVKADASREMKARAGQSIILLQKANQQLATGDRAGAISTLRQATALSPEFGEATFQLATLLATSLGSAPEAERLFRRVAEISPRYARAYAGLGALLLKRNRYEEAQSMLEHSLDLAPSLTEAHLELGKLAMIRKRFLDAVSEYGSALAWRPDDTQVRVQRAKALGESGNYKAAEQELNACIRENPTPDAYHYLGLTLQRTGRRAEAAAAFRTSEQLKYDKRPY
jgi:tetratricopeptide (TPR) repeat protein